MQKHKDCPIKAAPSTSFMRLTPPELELVGMSHGESIAHYAPALCQNDRAATTSAARCGT